LPEGIPTEEEFLSMYAREMGIKKIENWHFYISFSLFRIAAISQGVYKRALDGNASSETALSYGTVASALSELGWSVVTQAETSKVPSAKL